MKVLHSQWQEELQDMYIGILDNRIATLNKDIGNRVRICRMLGITGGAFLTILIV